MRPAAAIVVVVCVALSCVAAPAWAQEPTVRLPLRGSLSVPEAEALRRVGARPVDRGTSPALAATWPDYAQVLEVLGRRKKKAAEQLAARIEGAAPSEEARWAVLALRAELLAARSPGRARQMFDALPAEHPARAHIALLLGSRGGSEGRSLLETIPETAGDRAAADLRLAELELARAPAQTRDRLLGLPPGWLDAKGRARRLDLLGRALHALKDRPGARAILGRLLVRYPRHKGLRALRPLLKKLRLPGPGERVAEMVEGASARVRRRRLERKARDWKGKAEKMAAVAYGYGRVYSSERDRERALGRYERAIDLSRDPNLLLHAAAGAVQAARNLDRPGQVLSWIGRALRALERKRPKDAVPALALLDEALWVGRIVALLEQGRREEAETAFTTMSPWLRGRRREAELLLRLGVAAYSTGDNEAALRHFSALREHHNDTAGPDRRPYGLRAHVWLAHLAEERGDAAAARRLRSVLRQRWPLCDEAGPVDALPDGYSDWRRQPAPGLGGGPWQREARFYAWAGRNARLRSVLRSLLRRGRAGPEAVAALIYAELARGRSQAARHLVRMHGASLGREGTRAGALLPLSYPVRFVDEVREAAHAAGVPAELLAAVVRHESGFDPQARSSVGARGLTQLMPRTARAMAKRYMPDMPDAKKRWREPAINLQLGAHVLARLLERYKGDAGLALIAYASGPGRLAGALKGTEELPRPLRLDAVPLGQTVGYARRVLTARNIYRALLGNDLAAAASPIEGP